MGPSRVGASVRDQTRTPHEMDLAVGRTETDNEGKTIIKGAGRFLARQ